MSSLGPIGLAASGERRSGYFTFAADPGLAKYSWPFFSITGRRDGPLFLITAGIHAAEYTGIDAAIRLGNLLDPAQVRGHVVIIPLLNRPGFYERSIYVNPEDNDNMNRVFPGRLDGTWSERFAHWLLNEVIARCEYAVDLHAGDMIEDLVPFVTYRETGDERVDGRAKQMAEAYGAEWLVRAMPSGERAGLLFALFLSVWYSFVEQPTVLFSELMYLFLFLLHLWLLLRFDANGRLRDLALSGLALGAGTAAGSLGQFLFAPIGVALIDNFGWQQALSVFGFLMLLIIPLSLAISTPPVDMEWPTESRRSKSCVSTPANGVSSHIESVSSASLPARWSPAPR